MITQKTNSLPLEPAIKTGWMPIAAGIILSMLVGLLWWTLKSQEHGNRHIKIQDEAGKLISYLESDMHSRIPALERIVSRWEIRGGTPENEFINDGYSYIDDLPGFQALEWVDSSFHVRWVIPLVGNEKAVNLNLAFEENRRIALEKAKHRRKPTMTSPIDLVQGGKGFLIYLPIYVNGEFDGFVLAVFRIQEWLDYIFNLRASREELEDFRVAVSIDDTQVYKQPGWEKLAKYQLDEIADTQLLGYRFTVHCRPTESFIGRSSTFFPELISLIGLILTFLVAFIVYLFQKTSIEAWRAHSAKHALEIKIVEHKKTEEELHQISSSLTLATKAGKIGVWVWDIPGGSLSWSDLMYELYDIPSDVVPTYETWRSAVHPDDLPETESLLNLAVEGKAVFETEFRLLLPGQVIRYIQAAAKIERDSAGKPRSMTGVNWDITKRKEAEEQIRHLATHDALTDLPGLRLAEDRVLSAINLTNRNKTQAAVLFIDLDGFKSVNDTYGHDTGDALLKEIACRLLSCVRETDTVARVGGDEFLAILTDIKNSENVVMIARKIIEKVSLTFSFNGNLMDVGASIGIALYPGNGYDPESLIKQADDAMYVSKKGGKNRFTFSTVNF